MAVQRFRSEVGREQSVFCGRCHDPALVVDGAMGAPVDLTDARATAGGVLPGLPRDRARHPRRQRQLDSAKTQDLPARSRQRGLRGAPPGRGPPAGRCRPVWQLPPGGAVRSDGQPGRPDGHGRSGGMGRVQVRGHPPRSNRPRSGGAQELPRLPYAGGGWPGVPSVPGRPHLARRPASTPWSPNARRRQTPRLHRPRLCLSLVYDSVSS